MAAVSVPDEEAHEVLEWALAQERRLWDAFVARDRTVLAEIIAPDAIDVGPRGTLRTHDEFLEALEHVRMVTYAIDDLSVRLRPGAYVATYRVTVEGTSKGTSFAHQLVRSTSVWSLDGGQWRLVLLQETPCALT